MKRLLVFGSVVALLGGALGFTSRAAAQSATVTWVGPQQIYTPGHTSSNGSSPLMSYHNGTILPSAVVYAIFWGTSWSQHPDLTSGIGDFLSGYGGSDYAKTVDEYYQSIAGTKTYVSPTVTYGGSLFDSSTAAPRHPNPAAVLQEVGNVMQNNLVSNGVYMVYGDLLGTGAYCAYHASGTVNGVTIQVTWMPNPDTYASCSPNDTQSGHSPELATMADSSAHELTEARTDPTNGGWYDNSGIEVGDACNSIYSNTLIHFSTNNTDWKIQGEWSNNAYLAGAGMANAKGYKGCITG